MTLGGVVPLGEDGERVPLGEDGGSTVCSFWKSGVPRPVTLGSRSQSMTRLMVCDTNRIPSDDGVESGRIATRIIARCDVVETRAASAIQPGVEKTKWLLAQ